MRLQNCSECLTKLRSVTPDNRLIWKDKRVCIQCFKKLHGQQDNSLIRKRPESDSSANEEIREGSLHPVPADAAVKVAS